MAISIRFSRFLRRFSFGIALTDFGEIILKVPSNYKNL